MFENWLNTTICPLLLTVTMKFWPPPVTLIAMPTTAKITKAAAVLGPIVVARPQDVLAEHLRDRILKRDIPEGESLPPERDLVAQTGLTRSAVREALRMLAAEGLIQTRPGRSGGSVVTLPSHESVASAIHRFVKGRRISLRSLQETRELLEPILARLAAERRTETQLQGLQELHNELVACADNFRDFTLANLKWHSAVARASGNELLSTLLYSISHGVQLASMAEEYDTQETRDQVIKVHFRVTEAIASRQPELAERAMRQHMTATSARSLAPATAEVPLTPA